MQEGGTDFLGILCTDVQVKRSGDQRVDIAQHWVKAVSTKRLRCKMAQPSGFIHNPQRLATPRFP